MAEKQEKLFEKVGENTTQATKVLDNLSKQTHQSIEIAKQSLIAQTKMVEKLDKNDEKFYTSLNQLEQNREANKQTSEEANIKFHRAFHNVQIRKTG